MGSRHQERRHTKLPFSGGFKTQFDSHKDVLGDKFGLNPSPREDENLSLGERFPLPTSEGIQGTEGHNLQVKEGHPWHVYEKRFNLILGGEVFVSQMVTSESTETKRNEGRDEIRLYAVRSFHAPNVQGKVKLLQKIRHQNFISIHQVFFKEQTCYTVSDLDEISLDHFSGPKYNLTEMQVAAITFQVGLTDDPLNNSSYPKHLRSLRQSTFFLGTAWCMGL